MNEELLALAQKRAETDALVRELMTYVSELQMAANKLLRQITIGDFTDRQGHSAKTLKTAHDLMRVLGRVASPAPGPPRD